MTGPSPNALGEYTHLVAAARRNAEIEESFGVDGLVIDPTRIADLRRRNAAARSAAAETKRTDKAAALAEAPRHRPAVPT